ncbi:polymer-forming cytoskeletal protein [Franconibacter sp. IITDAS19]|uniref:bactofilin family protein n=1 Tax=Franconibacter TaxID=1649295 RepID=UPI000463B1AD|nr:MULTISPECIES: polymer-forming cytoskeletal protein [Franconibacter]MCK1969810.1 polymer-forming cytoskeletal protein [Franconibacter sp. IITDAS19]
MDRRFLFLNAGLCFWSLALAAWCYHARNWALPLACLTLLAFTLHPLQQQVFTMFGKMKTTAETPQNKVVTAPQPVEKEPAREEKQNNTVVAADVRFEGNITAAGQVYIYGAVYGNIDSSGGIIKIMRSGLVEGNITSRELIVDGTVNGQCRSESIDIYEHGKIHGAIAYATLSIKKGGALVGQSEIWTPVETQTNILDFSVEQPIAAEAAESEAIVGPQKPAKEKKQA